MNPGQGVLVAPLEGSSAAMRGRLGCCIAYLARREEEEGNGSALGFPRFSGHIDAGGNDRNGEASTFLAEGVATPLALSLVVCKAEVQA